jgi:hypothetical protein
MMQVGDSLRNLSALSARGTFWLGLPGVARNALTPGYPLPRLRRWWSEVLLLVLGTLDWKFLKSCWTVITAWP